MASVSSSFQPYRTDTQSNKLYLYFWHTYSPVMYSLYEIDVPNPLPPPPTKDVQDEQILNPNHLAPILELKTGEYPGNMCCVSLGSKLYFMGGEYDIDYPCIGAGVKINYKNDFFPRDVYIFDPTKSSSLLDGTAMNSGKSWPWAFVADEKIYVLGSNFTTDIFDKSWRKDSELKSLSLFEVYHPKDDKWTILPNPPLDNVETRWAGHAFKRRKVFFIARQRGIERLYCFDLERDQWTKGIALPSNLRNVSGRIEVIEGTLYGCYLNTIAAIAPVAEEEDEGEEREQEMEEGEEEERVEWEEEDELNIQQQQEEDEMGAWFRNYGFRVVSREMGMEAIFNVPQQLQSSSTLLHLGSRCFCYIKTGMPPHPKYGRDHAIEDDKVRVISIVIFRALRETYKEGAIRPFRAKFLHSAHYAVKTLFPNEGVIHGCFSLGWVCPTMASSLEIAKKAKEAFVDDSFKLAVDLFCEAIDLSPNDANLFADRAQAHLKLNNLTEAAADASKAIEIDPSMAKAYLRKGTACMKLGEYLTAKEALEIGTSLAQNDSRFTKMLKECDQHLADFQPSTVPASASKLSDTTAGTLEESKKGCGMQISTITSVRPKYSHGYYQKPEEVVVTIYAKGIPANNVVVDFGEQILSVTIGVHDEDAYYFQPRLFGKIIPDKCRYEVLSTKVEIRLAKAEIINWPSLEYSKEIAVPQKVNVLSVESQRLAYPSSMPRKRDWDKLEAQVRQEEKEGKLDGDAGVNRMFQDIYLNADEDMRRAMSKSFMESNGTVLSTDWTDVGSKKVEATAPDGMELKKWEY